MKVNDWIHTIAGTFVFLNRENPETIKEMEQVDKTQDDLDDYLSGLE